MKGGIPFFTPSRESYRKKLNALEQERLLLAGGNPIRIGAGLELYALALADKLDRSAAKQKGLDRARDLAESIPRTVTRTTYSDGTVTESDNGGGLDFGPGDYGRHVRARPDGRQLRQGTFWTSA